jgi:hypothetical protein
MNETGKMWGRRQGNPGDTVILLHHVAVAIASLTPYIPTTTGYACITPAVKKGRKSPLHYQQHYHPPIKGQGA